MVTMVTMVTHLVFRYLVAALLRVSKELVSVS